jgi:YcxB-like protein
MTISFKADENDMVLFQLYKASKSQHIAAKRKKARRTMSISFLILGPLLFLNGHGYAAIILIAVAIGWYFIYPVWEAGYYQRHYESFIAERCRTVKYSGTEMQFNSEYIITKEEGTEGRIFTSELESITEITKAVYILFKNGNSFILPKNKIDNINELIHWLKQLAAVLNRPYNSELDWVWR